MIGSFKTVTICSLLALAACNQNNPAVADREAEGAPTPAAATQESAAQALANVSPATLKPENIADADIARLGGAVGTC